MPKLSDLLVRTLLLGHCVCQLSQAVAAHGGSASCANHCPLMHVSQAVAAASKYLDQKLILLCRPLPLGTCRAQGQHILVVVHTLLVLAATPNLGGHQLPVVPMLCNGSLQDRCQGRDGW